jgi:hypothetical protein
LHGLGLRRTATDLADFEWDWPKSIDRAAVEPVLSLGFLEAESNVILAAAQGRAETMAAKYVAHEAVLHGVLVLRMSAADFLLAVRAVSRGDTFLSPEVAGPVLTSLMDGSVRVAPLGPTHLPRAGSAPAHR